MKWAAIGMGRTTDRDTLVWTTTTYPDGLEGYVVLMSHNAEALYEAIARSRAGGLRIDSGAVTENLELLVHSGAIEDVLDALAINKIVAVPVRFGD